MGLIVTMDDASNEHYSMFFVDEEGTQSSFQGYMRLSTTMESLPHFILIAAATTGIPQRPARKWTRRI